MKTDHKMEYSFLVGEAGVEEMETETLENKKTRSDHRRQAERERLVAGRQRRADC